MTYLSRTEILCLMVMLSVSCVSTDKKHITSYYLMNMCGTSFNMDENDLSEMLLQLTDHGSYSGFFDCEVEIITSVDHTLMFTFMHVEIPSCADWVRLYEISTNSSHALTNELCSKPAVTTYTTSSHVGIVNFHSGWFGNVGGFKILITSFYTRSGSTCVNDYFSCKNGRCIKSNLFCNSRDNCGDNSDDYENCEGNLWWIILLGCLIGAGVILSVVFVAVITMKKQKRAKTSGKVHVTHSGYPHAFVSPPAHPNPQGYTGGAQTGFQTLGPQHSTLTHVNPQGYQASNSASQSGFQSVGPQHSGIQKNPQLQPGQPEPQGYPGMMTTSVTDRTPSAPPPAFSSVGPTSTLDTNSSSYTDGEVPGPAVYINPPQAVNIYD